MLLFLPYTTLLSFLWIPCGTQDSPWIIKAPRPHLTSLNNEATLLPCPGLCSSHTHGPAKSEAGGRQPGHRSPPGVTLTLFFWNTVCSLHTQSPVTQLFLHWSPRIFHLCFPRHTDYARVASLLCAQVCYTLPGRTHACSFPYAFI